MFLYIHILSYYKLFLYFSLCLNVMLDGLSCSCTFVSFLTTSCSIKTQTKVKEQLVVRKDMNAQEHERLSNITLRHKLK
jgi:hypothetical protein